MSFFGMNSNLPQKIYRNHGGYHSSKFRVMIIMANDCTLKSGPQIRQVSKWSMDHQHSHTGDLDTFRVTNQES